MHTLKLSFICLTFLCAIVSAQAQATFQNLNFEAAKIIRDQSSPYYPYAVNSTNALPGWTVLDGLVPPSDILYNSVLIGGGGQTAVSIHDTNDAFGFTPLQGNYSVFFQGGVIAQTGQILNTAHSLTFWSSYSTGLQVTFNGQAIPYLALGSGANYTVYGGDISSFAGQTGELSFSGGGFLDNIQFLSSPVPEPTSLALFGVGTLLLGFYRRRNSSL